MFDTNKIKGMIPCLIVGVIAYYLGSLFPIIGGPVFGILLGMLCSPFIVKIGSFKAGITFTSKKVLQYAVILLGFGLNLTTILKVGLMSLPIIISTIFTALFTAFIIGKIFNIPRNATILIGVGSSICGGSAIAATAPIIDAKDNEIAKAISVVFFFNVVAALIFPTLGDYLHLTNSGFALFAGTAINDTSSVTAAASSWDSIHHTGSYVLDTATIVKLTRTLAIIPITLCLGYYFAKKNNDANNKQKVSVPTFIIYFLLASLTTTLFHLALDGGLLSSSWGHYLDNIFSFLKHCSKFFIILAMTAIGFYTNIIELIKTGGKPLIMGLSCWFMISTVSLLMQHLLGLW